MTARFWVGGTGTWDASDTTHWAATSGGAGGQSVPGAADSVTFDANSGAGTVTLATAPTILSLSLSGFTGTFASGGNEISVSNSNAAVFVGGTTYTLSGALTVNLTYSGATGTRTINSLGPVEANAVNFNVKAGTDTINLPANGRVKSIDFTGFSGTLTINGNTVYGNLTLSSSMTITPGTATLFFSGTNGTYTITMNGITLDHPVRFSGSGGIFVMADAFTLGATRQCAIFDGTVKLKSGVTSSVGSLITSTATQKYLQSTTPGAQATLSDLSGVNGVNNLTIQDIAATGGAAWNAPINLGNVDGGNNSGWSFAPAGEVGSRAAMSLGLGLSL